MPNTVQHKRTSTPNASPNTSQVAVGELALNLADKRLFTSNGSVIIDLNRARPRSNTIASSATPTPNYDTEDKFFVTALNQTATFQAPTGSPEQGSLLLIRIKDNGTARLINWNNIYRASNWLPLPTTTTVNMTMNIGFVYNATDLKWDLLAVVDGL